MKVCRSCGESKADAEFYLLVQRGTNEQSWRYLDAYCKPCRSVYTSDRRRERKRRAVAYLGGSCVDCGFATDRVEVYDFHHPDPAAKDFAMGQVNRKWERIVDELSKCVLLCANCHRIRHAVRE